jgi:protein-tyrosine phosphatase
MADPKSEVGKDVERGETKDTPFDNILNFRDVGKTINAFLGEKYVLQAQLHNLGANTDHVAQASC